MRAGPHRHGIRQRASGPKASRFNPWQTIIGSLHLKPPQPIPVMVHPRIIRRTGKK